MEENELTAYEKEFVDTVEEIKDLFLKKNRGYNGENPFLNFIVGARLLYNAGDLVGCFEALKAYVAKHISNIYTHTLDADGIEESCKDIATYMIIATIMKRQLTMQQTMRKVNQKLPEKAVPELTEEQEVVDDAD